MTSKKSAVRSLEITPQKELNWIGINVHPPESLIADARMIRQRDYAQADILSTPGLEGEDPYHITLGYAFDVKHHAQVVKLVQEAKLTEVDLKWDQVYGIQPPHLVESRQAVICVDIHSEKIDGLKAQIASLTGVVNPAERDFGRKIPSHVTLMTLRLPIRTLSITPQHKKKFNWIGVNVDPPGLLDALRIRTGEVYKNAMLFGVPGTGDEEPYHVTICYGFDPKHYEKASELVKEAKLTEQDIKWGTVYAIEPQHLKDIVIIAVDAISDKIQALKEKIMRLTGAQNPAEKAGEGRKIPLHVTLMKLRLLPPEHPK